MFANFMLTNRETMVKPITSDITRKHLSWYGHEIRDNKNVAKAIQ